MVWTGKRSLSGMAKLDWEWNKLEGMAKVGRDCGIGTVVQNLEKNVGEGFSLDRNYF